MKTKYNKLLKMILSIVFSSLVVSQLGISITAYEDKLSNSYYYAFTNENKLKQINQEIHIKELNMTHSNKYVLTKTNATKKYPTQKGVILVTSDTFKGLPLGHAAIIYNNKEVAESLSNGVQKGKNNWNKSKKKAWAVIVKNLSNKNMSKAADYCFKKIGIGYNYNFLNITCSDRFYCSQLIYAAYYDTFRIDFNTKAFATGSGNPIHPTELVSTPKTTIIWKK